MHLVEDRLMANIQELLMLRTEFEEITESFNMTTHGSSINIIEWFTENGHRSNSLRPGYGRAREIADILWGEYNGAKEITAGVNV